MRTLRGNGVSQHRIQWPGGGGAKKHEIYVAAFGSHLFYDLFVQGWGGGHGPLGTPLDPLLGDTQTLPGVIKFI